MRCSLWIKAFIGWKCLAFFPWKSILRKVCILLWKTADLESNKGIMMIWHHPLSRKNNKKVSNLIPQNTDPYSVASPLFHPCNHCTSKQSQRHEFWLRTLQKASQCPALLKGSSFLHTWNFCWSSIPAKGYMPFISLHWTYLFFPSQAAPPVSSSFLTVFFFPSIVPLHPNLSH